MDILILCWLTGLTLFLLRPWRRVVKHAGDLWQLRLPHVWITWGRVESGKRRIIVWAFHRRLTPLGWWHRDGSSLTLSEEEFE